ncbi:nicotinamide N-methyltransferase-like [Rhinoderma darwinii]|uniref:nicotinamide N-methyltransferase-like n=1 Tax=Rhinoderma darwinii TaxID=43563 RepID=UPI003F675A13
MYLHKYQEKTTVIVIVAVAPDTTNIREDEAKIQEKVYPVNPLPAFDVHLCHNRDQFEDKEGKLRSAIQHIVTCDLDKENMTDSLVLPPADCVISAWLLDAVSKNQDDCIRYLRKFSRLLKPEGHLIIIGSLGTTYFTVGTDKVPVFTYDGDFVRKILVGEGFIIDYCKVKEKTAVSDLVDHKAVMITAAHKEK